MGNERLITVSVPGSPHVCEIPIASGLLAYAGEWFNRALGRVQKALIVTDTQVAPLYAERLTAALDGIFVETLVLDTGEVNKQWETLPRIYEAAYRMNLSRRDVIVALGGGVIGDMAGFAAATWLRGVRLVQVPTTLLAQVDAAIGGKTGVNFRRLKNAIGAFHQPDLVLVDPDVLGTLPEREFRAGLAEVLKYGMIETTCTGEVGFFEFLEAQAGSVQSRLAEIVASSCRIKVRVVEEDALESSGLRALLNFGHTFGHAYEEATGYDRLLHGEAVAVGMLRACRLAERLGMFAEADTRRVLAVYGQLGLRAEPPAGVSAEELMMLMRRDKKAETGQIRIVLPEQGIGRVALRSNVPEALILDVLAR